MGGWSHVSDAGDNVGAFFQTNRRQVLTETAASQHRQLQQLQKHHKHYYGGGVFVSTKNKRSSNTLTDDRQSRQLYVAAHVAQDVQPINLRHHKVLWVSDRQGQQQQQAVCDNTTTATVSTPSDTTCI